MRAHRPAPRPGSRLPTLTPHTGGGSAGPRAGARSGARDTLEGNGRTKNSGIGPGSEGSFTVSLRGADRSDRLDRLVVCSLISALWVPDLSFCPICPISV